jgi:hypothetical protein
MKESNSTRTRRPIPPHSGFRRGFATQRALIPALIVIVYGLTACSAEPPCCEEKPVATQAEIVDFTWSARDTDMLQVAENRAMATIEDLSIGEALVVAGFTADVTVPCEPIEISLPTQNNPAQEKELRRTVAAQFPAAFRRYADCLIEAHPERGSEIFGGVSDLFVRYPSLTEVTVVSDGCENQAIPKLCRGRDLRKRGFAEQAVASLPPAAVPDLAAGRDPVHIEYVGLGRGTGLDAAAVAGLRDVYATWTTRIHATHSFGPS